MQPALYYKDIILKHKKSIVKSRSECDVTSEIAGKSVAVPVFCSNMPSVLTYDIVKIFDKANWFHVWHRMSDINSFEEDGFTSELATKTYIKRATIDKLNFVSISVGVKQEDVDLLVWVLDKGYKLDSITIDVALIYNTHFESYIKWVRKNFPNTYLIAGNCDSFEAVKWLENLGVDCAKIFVGVSSSCRTREFSGFSSSTISDLIKIQQQNVVYREPWQIPQGCCDRYEIPPPLKIKILTDGGLTIGQDGQIWIGDIAKSIRFCANYIMSGKLFANCIDSPALLNGYSGNSTARIKGHSRNIEGTTVNVISNGFTIREMMTLIEDSLKSSVSYSGGKTLEALKSVNYEIIN